MCRGALHASFASFSKPALPALYKGPEPDWRQMPLSYFFRPFALLSKNCGCTSRKCLLFIHQDSNLVHIEPKSTALPMSYECRHSLLECSHSHLSQKNKLLSISQRSWI